MKKTFFLVIITCLLAFPFLALAAPAKDKVVSSTPAAISSSTAAKVIKVIAKNAIKRCQIIEPKIQAKVTGFDNTKLKHLTVYDNLKSRLTSAAEKLAARGADVATLIADLAVLDQKIEKFKTDYADYITKLKGSQESVCGKSEQEFRAKLKETKLALQQVHKDASDIRSYTETTIKADLIKIKTFLNPNATTTIITATTTRPAAGVKPVKIKSIVPGLPTLD